MPDNSHQSRSPLEAHVTAKRLGRQNGEAGVRVTVLRDAPIAVICARKDQSQQLAQAVREAFGLELPEHPRWVSGRSVSAQWDGPERWLLVFDEAPAGDLETYLTGRLGENATIVDQSHARFRLHITGPSVRDVLARGFAIDLHNRTSRPGDVALTRVAHINVTLVQLDAAPTYEIAGPRSSAASFWHWLEASAGKFGLLVQMSCGHRTAPISDNSGAGHIRLKGTS